MMKKRCEWGLIALAAVAGILGGSQSAIAHHGGGHCKYVWDDKYGTPYEITFTDGLKVSGILFVMGNKADEIMVEIANSGACSNINLCSIAKVERRKGESDHHILDFTTDKGLKFSTYDSCNGNILFFKTDFGILDLSFSDVESMIAPPATKKAAN